MNLNKTLDEKVHFYNKESALKLFKLDNGFYPDTEQGLKALIQKPTTGRIPLHWREGGYLDKNRVPKDPWGLDYIYRCPGTVNTDDYDLLSAGPDGREGTDDDIGNTRK